MLKMGIGDRIREFGINAFGSLGGLASALNLSPQQLSNYIAERNLPGTPFLLKLAEHGCDLHWLLTEPILKGEKKERPLRCNYDNGNDVSCIIKVPTRRDIAALLQQRRNRRGLQWER